MMMILSTFERDSTKTMKKNTKVLPKQCFASCGLEYYLAWEKYWENQKKNKKKKK